MICTVFKDIFSKDPRYITVDAAIQRITTGRSRDLVEMIRATPDKEQRQELKKKLVSVCFSGKFTGDRKDESLIEHSGFIVLDFDHMADLRDRQNEIISHDFVYACWVSPSGNGLKALVKIADGSKHREHFQALQEIFPDADKSGINPSRVCYESYDPDIYHYPDAAIFSKIKTIEKVESKESNTDEDVIFKKLLTWLSNKREAFVTGERNNFLFKLAAACCRYGINEISAQNLINNEFLVNSDFSQREAYRTIKSAYKVNANRFGDSVFERSILVEKTSRSEIKIDAAVLDESIKLKDVIYGDDVRDKAIDLYENGYPKVDGIGVDKIDYLWKPKRGEITLLTGIGNAGKSSFSKWYEVFRAVVYDEKFACFGPEDNPAEEYYHDLVEILLGCDCTPKNSFKPSKDQYKKAYDFITEHFFYIYPETAAPTPEYIKEKFLEVIIKHKVTGVKIDPFNQMANNYSGFAGRDKYLEYVLADFSRFAQINNVFLFIIAHPKLLEKDKSGNYVCPDVFDVADGSMWNNKMDNILVYHRPFGQTDPTNPMCEFHSKKIRRQKVVGKKGFLMFEMNF